MRQAAFAFLPLLALAGAASAEPAAAPTAPVATSAAAPPAVNAYINITPKRLTFDRTRRNGTVFLLNQGEDPITVDISMIDRVMLPDGQILAADEAAQRSEGKAAAAALKSAKELVQVSPRRVTLAPGRPQTVRVRIAAPPEGADGERRSHLTVTTLPPRDSGATAEAAAANPGAAGQLRFQITAVYGLSIPVIVRAGEPDVRAAIENARIEYAEVSPDGRAPPRRTAIAVFEVVRAGPSSLYGNFEVRPAGDRRGAEALGLARGVGVYPEITRRAVRIPLSRPPAAGEQLEVTFTDDDTSPGKVLAKAAF